MGGVCGGLLLAVATAVAVGSVAACSFGIDTSGLAGDGGQVHDATRADAPADGRVEAHPGDGGTDATRPDTGGSEASGPDGGTDGAQDGGRDASDGGSVDAGDATSDDCSIVSVQAVPGTSVDHVMIDGGSEQQSITETAGNLLVAIAYGGQGPGNTTPLTTVPNMHFDVTDTIGNTYYAAPMYENSRSNQAAIQIFYAPNIKGGANTVTATSTTTLGLMLQTGLFLQEYSGAATTNVVDISSGRMAPLSTSVVEPGNMTTSLCGRVVAAFTDGHVDGQSLSVGSGWNMRSSDDWDPGAASDSLLPGVPAGSVVNGAFNLSLGADDGWVAAQVAFRGATTPSPAQPDSVVFVDPGRTASVGACSPAINVNSQRGSTATNTSTGIRMSLSGTAGLAFYIDPGCVYPIKDLYIGAGAYSQTFYFVGSNKGPATITLTPTTLPVASQTETVD